MSPLYRPGSANVADQALDRAERHFNAAAPSANFRGGRLARAIHPILLSACLDPPEVAHDMPTVRRASISDDGTPILFSFKSGDGQQAAAFRCVGEPGGYAVDTADQILRALACAKEMCAAVGWSRAWISIHTTMTDLLPPAIAETRQWWGGVWVGFDSEPAGIRLKVYASLRAHSLDTRWDMVAAAFRRHGGSVVDLRAVAESGSVSPMGVCLVYEDDRPTGMRLYLDFDRPDPVAVARFADHVVDGAFDPVHDYCNQFCRAFGAFEPHSVACGVDFAMSSAGRLTATASRVKAELCAELLPPSRRTEVLPWFTAVVAALGIVDRSWTDAIDQAAQAFDGVLAKYASLGVSKDGARQATVYVHPLGLQLKHGLQNGA